MLGLPTVINVGGSHVVKHDITAKAITGYQDKHNATNGVWKRTEIIARHYFAWSVREA